MKRRQINIATLDSTKARLAALHTVINAVLNNRIDPEVARTRLYAITSSQTL